LSRQVIGIEKGINKKYNTPFTILHTVSAFDKYAVDNRGAEGQRAENTYIRADVDCSVGDNVDFEYQPGFNNEAVVSGIRVL
jgi:hypothetical protein